MKPEEKANLWCSLFIWRRKLLGRKVVTLGTNKWFALTQRHLKVCVDYENSLQK